MKSTRITSIIVVVLFAVARVVAESLYYSGGSIELAQQGAPASEINSCASCHRQTTREVFAAFTGSTHAQMGITCDGCHGGDASEKSKAKAHGSNFVGRPNAAETLALCSACHTNQFEAFKTSRHFPEQKSAPRMDCAFCHGSHSIGSPASTMSFKLQCSSCHGLEYLPDLPVELQTIIGAADEQKASLASILKSGRKPSEQLLRLRARARRLISEIVHRTDVKRAKESLAEINRLGDEFRQASER
jgi:cytochrome c553